MNELEFNLLDFFLVLKRRMKLVIISVILFTLIFGVFTVFFTEKKYQSSARIMTKPVYVNNVIDYEQLSANNSMATIYVELLKGSTICSEVAKELGVDQGLVKDSLTIIRQGNTQIISISAKTTNPELSKNIIDTLLDVFYKETAKKLGSSGIITLDEAQLSRTPITADLTERILQGAFLGLFLSCAVIFLQFILDNHLNSKQEAEKYFKLPVLGVVPDMEKLDEIH